MTDDLKLIERLRKTLGSVDPDVFGGDNLAIFLAAEFEPGCESEELDDSGTWKQEALDKTNAVLDAIHAHYAPAIERLTRDLRTMQNAAKTIAAAHGTELEHLRQNHAYDHKLRAEHESLKALNSQITDMCLAAEADRDRLAAQVAEMPRVAALIRHLVQCFDAGGESMGRSMRAGFAEEVFDMIHRRDDPAYLAEYKRCEADPVEYLMERRRAEARALLSRTQEQPT